jgi:hypothetical protein
MTITIITQYSYRTICRSLCATRRAGASAVRANKTNSHVPYVIVNVCYNVLRYILPRNHEVVNRQPMNTPREP